MTNEKPISKEHAEQIWEAVLQMASHQNDIPYVMAENLVKTRQMLDKADKPSEMQILKDKLYDAAFEAKIDLSYASSAITAIDAARVGGIDFEKLYGHLYPRKLSPSFLDTKKKD